MSFVRRILSGQALENTKNRMVPELSYEQFIKLMSADPTFRESRDQIGKYGKWIADSYPSWPPVAKREVWRNPDVLAEMTGVIKVLHRLREQNKLPAPVRTFWEMPFAKVYEWLHYNGDELLASNKSDQEAKIQDAAILFDDGSWVIVTPKTHQASCAWGHNTNWCTAINTGTGVAKYEAETSKGPVYYINNQKNKTEKFAVLPAKGLITNAKQTQNFTAAELADEIPPYVFNEAVKVIPGLMNITVRAPYINPNAVNQSFLRKM